MASRWTERMLNVVREMQIKATRKKTKITHSGKEKDEQLHASHTLLVEMQISVASMENSVEAPQRTKNRTAIWGRRGRKGRGCWLDG
jgi:hypothetical protein